MTLEAKQHWFELVKKFIIDAGHIFTGPTSAMQMEPNKSWTKKGQASINKLEHVTPRTIAYVAMHVSYVKSVVAAWPAYFTRLVGFSVPKMTGTVTMASSIWKDFSI